MIFREKLSRQAEDVDHSPALDVKVGEVLAVLSPLHGEGGGQADIGNTLR